MTYTPTIISRADWGALEPKSDLGPVPGPHSAFMVAHHQGLDPARPGYDRAIETVLADEAATVRAIQRQHQAHPDSRDIEYNWLIGPSGRIYEGRGWRQNAANGTHNSGLPFGHVTNVNSRSFCLLGHGGDPRCFTLEVRLAFAWLAAAHVYVYQDGRNIGHRDIVGTACPGDLLYDWWTSGAHIPLDDDGQPKADEPVEVQPMWSPAINVRMVAACAGPHGQGALVLGDDGGVFITPDAPVRPAAQGELISPTQLPAEVWGGRTPAQIECDDDGRWTVITTSGDRYTFPTPA
jgi:hypothetical protein